MNVSEALEIGRILEYSGFDDSEQLTITTSDRFDSYDDILTIGDSDIANLAKGFSDRTVETGKICFGLRRTHLLKKMIHWDQYFRRTIETPSLVGINNSAKFFTARKMYRIRKQIIEEPDILIKAANTGNLKRHKYWITWPIALKNHLSKILGQDRVPLIYVIRESEAPDYTIDLQPDYDFE